VILAIAFIVRQGTPSEEESQRITTTSHQQLVAAT
jgi:hypothetical protein